MDTGSGSQDGAFNKLPIEMNWAIASYLESDKDICAFRSICRQTRDAIEGNNHSFWRIKFREKYAPAEKAKTNVDLKAIYQTRAKRLSRGASEDFQLQGHGKSELRLLDVLRSLIVESFQGTHGYDKHGRPLCPNQEHIMRFILNSKSFLGIRPTTSGPRKPVPGQEKPHPLFVAVQIMCAQLLFSMEAPKYDIISFDDSQKMVYARMKDEPMFSKSHGDLQVNMTWTLNCLSFFRHHMVREEAQSLYASMEALSASEWPSAWREPLKDGCYRLSKQWKGTYSYLDTSELARLRRPNRKNRDPEAYFIDKNIEDGGKIQSLELEFIEDDKLHWPAPFENRLQSRIPTMAPRTRAQHRHSSAPKDPVSIRIQGSGVDHEDEFFASGWLNPLAKQQGIPGWQRVTLMKHFVDDYDQVMDDDLWAYEGVVLPGGRMMLGRWWFANEERETPNYGSYCGPFILWAVDEE